MINIGSVMAPVYPLPYSSTEFSMFIGVAERLRLVVFRQLRQFQYKNERLATRLGADYETLILCELILACVVGALLGLVVAMLLQKCR